jgi:hypothetical protein
MRNNDLVWELFDDDAYQIGLNPLVEYKSERILVEDEWGSEYQYRVYDVKVLIDFDTNYVNVPLTKGLKASLEERIEEYLNK